MDVFCGCENVCKEKHTTTLVWAANEGRDVKQSAFLWVLAGILVDMPFSLLFTGIRGAFILEKRSPFPEARKGQKET